MENNEKINEVEILEKEALLEKIKGFQKQLDDLRANGVTLIDRLKNENSNIKTNKQLNKEQKVELINANNARIAEAKEVKTKNAEEIKTLVQTSVKVLKANFNVYIKELKDKNKRKIAKATEIYNKEQLDIKAAHEDRLNNITTLNAQTMQEAGTDAEAIKEAKLVCKNRTGDENLKFRQQTSDSKVRFADIKAKHKDEEHELYLEMSHLEDNLTNGRIGLASTINNKFENYVYNFKLKNFFLNNGLYVGIIILLIFTIIYYAATYGQFLLGSDQIFDILENVSPKIFFALGVACIIVLGGTDLSIGSLVGMGAIFTVMLCSTDGSTGLTMFGNALNFSAIPLGVRVPLAFILSISSCVAFSALAGYFTAKFKMHPFISTLSTQLIVVGIVSLVTANSRTGYSDPALREGLTGRIGGVFPIMVFFAIAAIIVMWFIWNKTRFGKNLYAVGGNGEAATVSGISVFKTTLLAFVLAGIYYGIGSSLYGIYSGSTYGTMAVGMEADAIAACVVGGVSFSGGVGKISGVVIGAILFQAITYILVLLGITDANAQFVIKGIIILAAVALDCAKYLKKK